MSWDPGWVGVWLLVAGAVAIVIEGVLAAVWALAVGKRTRVLAERLQAEQTMLEEDVRRLRLALQEMELLWQPYGRALRWLRHPLIVALLQSYARRRAL
jgi:hypothetical protein